MTAATTAAGDWGAVAPAWDSNADYVERHSVAGTDALVGAAGVRPGDRVLELAAGPGTLGGRWSQLVGPSGRVVLSDIAPEMVDVARRRNAHHPNVDVAVLDASSIDEADGSFDVVVCRMGLMFAPDPAVALAEIRRVLRDGGRLAAMTWAGIEHNPWMTCVGMAAMMNGLVAGGPPVGPGGIFSLGDPARLATLARDAAFVDVIVEEVPTVFESDSIDTHVERVSALAGPLAAAFLAATPEQLDAVRRTAAQLAAEHVGEHGVSLPGRALVVAGRV
ncbi:MAG: class I SAM-dependent methyltransferase [Ilumatobacteraceae bacterium]